MISYKNSNVENLEKELLAQLFAEESCYEYDNHEEESNRDDEIDINDYGDNDDDGVDYPDPNDPDWDEWGERIVGGDFDED